MRSVGKAVLFRCALCVVAPTSSILVMAYEVCACVRACVCVYAYMWLLGLYHSSQELMADYRVSKKDMIPHSSVLLC